MYVTISPIRATYIQEWTIYHVSIIAVRVDDIATLNIYEQPNEKWPLSNLPHSPHQYILAGNFNSHHTD